MVTITSLPQPMTWDADPVSWSYEGGVLKMAAGPRTDMFVDPGDDTVTVTAPRLLARVDGDFQLSAKVTVGFANSYDAGVLLLWADERAWAKLCFEYSPHGQPMIVSVVTRGVSDDANGFTVDGKSVWLRVSRLGTAYAYHASTDGRFWHLIRHFSLGEAVAAAGGAAVGFEAQSPLGTGASATFTDIRFIPQRLADIRDGH